MALPEEFSILTTSSSTTFPSCDNTSSLGDTKSNHGSASCLPALSPLEIIGNNQNMSLLAQFDDLCHQIDQSFSIIDDDATVIRDFLENIEKLRVQIVERKRQNNDLKVQLDKIVEETQGDETSLEVAREAYRLQMDKRLEVEAVIHKCKKIFRTLNQTLGNASTNHENDSQLPLVKDLIKCDGDARPSIASSVDSDEFSEELLFDKSSDFSNISSQDGDQTEDMSIFDVNNMEFSLNPSPTDLPNDLTIETPKKSFSNNLTMISSTPTTDVANNVAEVSLSTPLRSRTAMAGPSNQSNGSLLRFNKMISYTRFDASRINDHPHQYQYKNRTLRHLECDVCLRCIRFFGKFAVCKECHSVCHPQCQSALPLPCMPKVISKGAKRMLNPRNRELICLSDFVNVEVRPCVPALIVFCCKEIVRRSKYSSYGQLYERKANDQREVLELRNKMIQPEHGLPNLGKVSDINIITDILKSFLLALTEPVLTNLKRIEFVQNADELLKKLGMLKCDDVTSDYGSTHTLSDGCSDEVYNDFKSCILDLPNANRDSLSYLMLHFHELLNKKPALQTEQLRFANIFGPIFVGGEMREFRDRISKDMKMEELGRMQSNTARALFQLSTTFWRGLLSENGHFSPFDETFKEG